MPQTPTPGSRSAFGDGGPGRPLASPYKCDTITVQPGERYDAIVEADAAGAWVFHCQVLSHAQAKTGMFGMVAALIVS